MPRTAKPSAVAPSLCLLSCLVSFLLTPAAILAQEIPFAPAVLSPPAYPTVVSFGIYDLEILAIDAVEETYTLEADLLASWLDPRLAFDEDAVGNHVLYFQNDTAREVLKTHIWGPDVELVDGRGARETTQIEVEVSSDGSVFYRERMLAKVKQQLLLHDFPFDKHTISVSIEPFSYEGDAVVFQPFNSTEETSSWDPTDWAVSEVRSEYTWGASCSHTDEDCTTDDECVENARAAGDAEAEEAWCGPDFADLTVSMDIERNAAHFVWKIILPLVLIVFVSSGVFWLSMKLYPDPGDRVTIAFTALLTCVAFDFVASDSLPKLWYTTALDRILITSYIFLALNIVENVMVVARIGKSPEGAEKIDHVARWLFPLCYLVCVGIILVRAS